MGSLFQDKELSELPLGLLTENLDNVEAAVLKTIAFIDETLSKYEVKSLVKDIFSEVHPYKTIKKGTIDASVESLEDKDLLVHYSAGLGVDPDLVSDIFALAKDNYKLIYGILNSLSGYNSYMYRFNVIHLAFLINDFEKFDKLTEVSKSYVWKNPFFAIKEALLKLGDLNLIKPFLPKFHTIQKDLFLNTLPYSLYYNSFKDLKDIYLDKSVKPSLDSKYTYASCAHLILPVEEVEAITLQLKINTDSLFFIKLLHGDLDGALQSGKQFLMAYQIEEGHKRKELPGAFGLLYAIVLIVSGRTTDLNTAATFLRYFKRELSESQQVNNPFVSMSEVLLLFINHKTGKRRISADTLIHAYSCMYHRYFLTAVLKWLGGEMAQFEFPSCESDKEEFEYLASGLINEKETPKYHTDRLKELRDKFKVIPLAELLQAEEAWEEVISMLSKELQKTTKNGVENTPTAMKRLIWFVDPLNEYSLACVEQNRNKNGWSKGKERSLVRLVKDIPDFATPADRSILSCIKQSDYYRTTHYITDWDKLIRFMADHPDVYTTTEPHMPINIRIQDAQIQIDKNRDGATISFNPESPEPAIIQETPTSYIYINWSIELHRVYNIIAGSKKKKIIIPKQGMSKAMPVINRLREIMPVTGDLAKKSGKDRKSDNIPIVQMTPVRDQLHVQILIEVVKNGDLLVIPGVGSSELAFTNSEGQHFNVKRDKTKEIDFLSDLIEKVSWFKEIEKSSPQLFLDNDDDILNFLSEVKESAPEVKILWPKGERLRVAKSLSISDLHVNIKQNQNWFEVDGEVVVDKKLKLTVKDLIDKSNGGVLKYIQLDDKTYLSICHDLQKRLGMLDVVSHNKGKKLLVHSLGSATLEGFIEGAENVKTDQVWKDHLANMEQLRKYKPALPSNLKAELRPYQEDGVLWLDRLYNWGVGACLADDMGLGKTIQCISILLKHAKNGPALVLAPASVCNNWVNELTRFAPTLNIVFLGLQNREETLSQLKANDVMIVSYGIVQSNPDLLSLRDWNILILDEAHAIKNAKSVRSKAVMKLNAKFRIATTGTPMQNHLGELWNLFQFMNPGMLGSNEQFNKKYVQGNNVTNTGQNQRKLHKYIAPFILRRNKNDVLEDLPEKTEITLKVALSEEERAMYEVLRQEAVEQLSDNKDQSGAKHLQILAEITKLRQMSCNPALIAPDCKISSSKLEALENLVEELIEANHKALIFSQFTKHLSLIKKMLEKKGISYQYLDGSTPVKKREQAIDNFQNGQSDLFLISLKAGGVGLNLTAADYVIHMDPWWNPAVEDQASDRVHRIGQKRPVTIYRMIAENTIEEKIIKLHHDKRDLADKLLADTDQSAKISSDELMALLTENY